MSDAVQRKRDADAHLADVRVRMRAYWKAHSSKPMPAPITEAFVDRERRAWQAIDALVLFAAETSLPRKITERLIADYKAMRTNFEEACCSYTTSCKPVDNG